MQKEQFDITGMTCSACSTRVEKSVAKLPGIKEVSVNLLKNSMVASYDESVLDTAGIVQAVEKAGYGAIPKASAQNKSRTTTPAAKPEVSTAQVEYKQMKQRLLLSALFTIPLFYISMGHMMGWPLPSSLLGMENAISFAFTQFLLLIPVVFINFKYYRMGFKTLFHGSPNMDSLIAIGSSAAIVYGIYAIYKIGIGFGHGDMATVHSFMMDLYFESAGMILTLITLGKTLEARAKGKTSDAITKLMNLAPKTATVERDGKELQVSVEEVQLGETLIVKAGESVPVDGIVIEGFSSVDESALTGESIPVEKHIGDKVIGATTSKSGYFKMKKNKFEFIIDSEFQSQIPALTDEEFQQLEENILSEGEVLSPLIVWGNILVDGHNRYKILQQHPEIPYTTRSISCTCETREDVLAWICKHQLGRRNLTPEQKKFLIGKQYHSEKSTRGGNHGNQYTQVANCQIDNLPSVENTTERIAKENNVSPSFVIRAEQFMKTVELMEKYCPGIQEEILSGKLKLSQREATIIRGTPTEALPTVVSMWREEKLNGKPDDSADTYENSELLSKVAENNFSTAATSKIQTADPLSENRPFISSGKRSTELQTIRELGEKMATVDHVADAEGMFSEINSASDSFIFRLEQCFALYPDFLTNVEIEAKVIAALQKAESYIVHLKEQHHQHLLEATNRQ